MKYLLLVCLVGIGLSACAFQDSNNLNQVSMPQEKVSGITAETAVYIAKGFLCFDYDLRGADVEVKENEILYEVHFKKPMGENAGKGPTVFIHKSNGGLIYTINAK